MSSLASPPGRFSVVDIGSNTVKMSVYACDGGTELRTLESAADTVRIGHRVGETGEISEERLERLIGALREFQSRASTHDVEVFLAVATQAFRVARNSAAAVARIESETRWRVRVIDGEEETALTLAGARPWIEPGVVTVVADIGGASTEVITVTADGNDAQAGSIPIGSGSLFDEAIGSSPPPAGSLLKARDRAGGVFTESLLLPVACDNLLLPGGTGTYLALLAGALSPGTDLAPHTLDALHEWLGTRHAVETMERIPVQLDRAQVLPAGLAIVEALVLRIRPQRIVAMPSGIRDGIARSVCQQS
jgi:exopolyphosphatase / guanosine-5'-triphosphate,3'-diphosphate pyrophosphatase